MQTAYYRAAGPITDLTTCPPPVFDGLASDPAAVMKAVRGCVISAGALEREGLPVLSDREGEASIRPVAAIIARIEELEPGPLVAPRAPERRFLGNCRTFATLSCALLRRSGVPTRVRAGFAGYFVPGTWVDHWIIEYHDGDRWVRVDPELDDEWLEQSGFKATSQSLAENVYWSGAQAWQRCRNGELDPAICNMGGNWGVGEVRGSVMYDLACLNKEEMLPWDAWGDMKASYKNQTDDTYDALMDAVARVVCEGELGAIRRLYDGELRVPATLTLA